MNCYDAPVLGIETSCDETSCAVLNGTTVLSNVVSSQAALHEKWGGVVPEAAARAHVESILPVVDEAIKIANVGTPGAIAVTNRPGLVGALSVGVTAAKALSMAWQIRLIGVHHLEGHVMSTSLEGSSPPYPHLCVIVSGGHTELILVSKSCKYRQVGGTIDDAAGEAFDKGARLLGLGYPGGQAVQEMARSGDPNRYDLPRALKSKPYDFSFSGLKTAVLRLVEREGKAINVSDLAASLQEAIVDVLVEKSTRAAEDTSATAITLVGGVAANERLREQMKSAAERIGVGFFAPPLQFCTDNAAMIALAGSVRLALGERDGFELEVSANERFAEPIDADALRDTSV